MDPREPRDNRRIDAFRASVPQLTREAILGKPDRLMAAQQELVTGINNDPLLNPLFPAIETAQEIMLNPSNTRTLIRAGQFLAALLFLTGSAVAEKGTRRIDINPQIKQQIRRIKENDTRIQHSPTISKRVPVNYPTLINGLIPLIEGAMALGKDSAGVQFAVPISSGEKPDSNRQLQIDQHNA